MATLIIEKNLLNKNLPIHINPLNQTAKTIINYHVKFELHDSWR